MQDWSSILLAATAVLFIGLSKAGFGGGLGMLTTPLCVLAFGPKDDPDGDGYSNAREQIMGTNPRGGNVPFPVDLSPYNARLARLSWPGSTNSNYEVLAGPDASVPLAWLTNVSGRFPETEFFPSRTNAAHQFFRVRAAVPP